MVPAELDTVAKASRQREMCAKMAAHHDGMFRLVTFSMWGLLASCLLSLFGPSVEGVVLNAMLVWGADRMRSMHQDQAVLWRTVQRLI